MTAKADGGSQTDSWGDRGAPLRDSWGDRGVEWTSARMASDPGAKPEYPCDPGGVNLKISPYCRTVFAGFPYGWL